MTIEHPTVADGSGGTARLALVGISKRFPGVNALRGVDLAMHAGRAHALVGENGAGKSTLVKIISGWIQPNDGQIHLDGRRVQFRSPAEAKHLGVSLVPQELSLVPARSVAENVFMGNLPRRGPLVDNKRLRLATQELLERLGLDIDPFSPLESHAPAEQQLVMIARGMAQRGRLFILDEPTAALTDPEIDRLFVVLKELKASGAALLYVSHRLAELAVIAEDITVLRDGQVVDHLPAQGTSEDTLVRAMIGRPVSRFFAERAAQGAAPGPVRLSVRGLSRDGVLDDVSFDLRGGEIMGLAGLMGAGRTEVARALFGIDRFDRGEVHVDGKVVDVGSPRKAMKAGFALVPEERKAQAVVLGMSISDNIVLPHLWDLSTASVLSEPTLRAYSQKVREQVGVKAASLSMPIRTLSGGNQQKVVLGRWLQSEARIFVLDEPTRGIDVQAKSEIYVHIRRLAEQGAAVLVISSQLTELLGLCDRIMVMRFGSIVGEVAAADATEESLLQLAMIDEFLNPPNTAVEFPLPDIRSTTSVVAPDQASLPYSGVLPLPAGPIGDPARTYRFGFSQALEGSSWADAQRASFLEESGRHPNVDIQLSNTPDDPVAQVEALERFREAGVDAIVVWPHSPARLTLAVERARNAGIVVVGVERNIASRNYDSWIWLDYPKANADLAEAIAMRLGGRGMVAEVPGTLGTSAQILRHLRFAQAMRRWPGISIVTTSPTDWGEERGYEAARAMIASGIYPDAWYAHYAPIARGVWRAMSESGRSAIPIYTHVDDAPALAALREGRIEAVAPWTPLHGDIGLRAAAYHLTGHEAPKDIFLSQPPLITRSTVDAWAESGRGNWEVRR